MPTFFSHLNPLSRHPTACPRHPHIVHSHRPPGITPPRWCSWSHHCQTPHSVGYASGLPPSNFRCASSLSPLIGSAGAHHHRRGLMQHHRHRGTPLWSIVPPASTTLHPLGESPPRWTCPASCRGSPVLAPVSSSCLIGWTVDEGHATTRWQREVTVPGLAAPRAWEHGPAVGRKWPMHCSSVSIFSGFLFWF
jgi:hypothetical protein